MKSGFWSRLRLAGLKLLIITYEAGGSVWVEEAFTRGVGRGLVYHLGDLEGLGLIRVERRQYGIRVRTYITLTELGRRIAEHLKAADDLAPEVTEEAEGVE
jgi:DNA-binding HxlR family transcriptional regulator